MRLKGKFNINFIWNMERNMKLQDLMKNIKNDNLQTIVLAKSGSFYIAYDEDAYIMNYLFSYQINDNKIGFPIGSLSKVLEKLEEAKINNKVFDTDIDNKYEDNRYNEVLYVARRNYFNEVNAKLLMEEIEFLLKSNPDNINKIRNFINEL